MHIQINNLSKSFFLKNQEVKVLDNFNLEIKSKSFLTVTGTSGAGKSTLLHLLGTLDAPTQGEILLDNQNIFNFTPSKISNFRNNQIGFVFQFHHLLPELTALENTQLPLLINGQSKQKASQKASKWLSRMGLSDRLEHKPGELSGGEQQRVALARALVNHPRLLLADEPTGNLDEETGLNIINLIKNLNQEFGMTVILVTHNPRLIGENYIRIKKSL